MGEQLVGLYKGNEMMCGDRWLETGSPWEGDEMTEREQFEAWIQREMPAGTVISNPLWWAPRILQAARAASPKVPQGVEEWIKENFETLQEIGEFGEGGCGVNAVRLESLLEYLSGMAIVPVEHINKALHGLQHLKDDIILRSKMQEDCQDGEVFVGCGAWMALCAAIAMLAATKEKGE